MAADPLPGQTLVVDVELGTAETPVSAALMLDSHLQSAVEPPPLLQGVEGFVMPRPVIVSGLPFALPPAGGDVDVTGGVKSHTKVTSAVTPASIADELDAWARFRPSEERLGPIAQVLSHDPETRFWYADGWPKGGVSPRMRLFGISTANPSGRGSVRQPGAPYVAAQYAYQGRRVSMSRPAMVFTGKGMAHLEPQRPAFSDVTLAMVFVTHPTPYPWAGIYEASWEGFGEPLLLAYDHGHFDIEIAPRRQILRHRSIKSADSAMVVLLSFDTKAKEGRVVVLDDNRTSRTFSVDGLEFVSLTGMLAALGQGTLEKPWKWGAEMDLLELDIWNKGMDYAELEAKANLLALAYGVVS